MVAEVSVQREEGDLKGGCPRKSSLGREDLGLSRDDGPRQGKLRSRQEVSPTSPVGGQKKPTVPKVG